MPLTNAQKQKRYRQRMKAEGRWPKLRKTVPLPTGEKLIVKRQKDAERQRRYRQRLREGNSTSTSNLSRYAAQLHLATIGDEMVAIPVCKQEQDIHIDCDASVLGRDSDSSVIEYKPELMSESSGVAVLDTVDSEVHDDSSVGASISGQNHKSSTPVGDQAIRLGAQETIEASDCRVGLSTGDVILYQDPQSHMSDDASITGLTAQQKLERSRWLSALRQRRRRWRLRAEGTYHVYKHQNKVFSGRNRARQQEWEDSLPEDIKLEVIAKRREDTRIRVARCRQRKRQKAMASGSDSNQSEQLRKDDQPQKNEGHSLHSTSSTGLQQQILTNDIISPPPGAVPCSFPQPLRCQTEVTPKLLIKYCDDNTKLGQARVPSSHADDSCTIRIGLVTEFDQDRPSSYYGATPCAGDDSRMPFDFGEDIQTLKHHHPLVYQYIKTLQMDNANLRAENLQLKKRTLCLEKIKTDDTLFHFWTGFASYETFQSLFELVQPNIGPVTVPHATISPSLEEQFFYVLVRLRMGLFIKDIAARVGISEADYAILFHRWMTALLHQLQNVVLARCRTESELPHQHAAPDCIEVLVDCCDMVSEEKGTATHLPAVDQCKFVIGVMCNTGTVFYISDATSHDDEAVSLCIRLSHLHSNIVNFKREQTNQTRDCLVGVVNRIRSFHILDNYQTKLESDMFRAVFKVCALLSNAIK